MEGKMDVFGDHDNDGELESLIRSLSAEEWRVLKNALMDGVDRACKFNPISTSQKFQRVMSILGRMRDGGFGAG